MKQNNIVGYILLLFFALVIGYCTYQVSSSRIFTAVLSVVMFIVPLIASIRETRKEKEKAQKEKDELNARLIKIEESLQKIKG